jgi:hypothetical protein
MLTYAEERALAEAQLNAYSKHRLGELSRDSVSMRVISLCTLCFLPATFFSVSSSNTNACRHNPLPSTDDVLDEHFRGEHFSDGRSLPRMDQHALDDDHMCCSGMCCSLHRRTVATI